MQAPKKKTSKSRRDMRRAHHALTAAMPVKCSNCGEYKLRHRVCPFCGFYRGRQVAVIPTEAAAE